LVHNKARKNPKHTRRNKMTIKFTNSQKCEPMVGNTVRIKTNLCKNIDYGNARFVNPMKAYMGKKTTITNVYPDETITLEIDLEEWTWTKKMLNPI